MSVSSLRSSAGREFQGTVADGRASPRPSARRGMVGVRGFEPPTPCSQSRCATGLRHTPGFSEILSFHLLHRVGKSAGALPAYAMPPGNKNSSQYRISQRRGALRASQGLTYDTRQFKTPEAMPFRAPRAPGEPVTGELLT